MRVRADGRRVKLCGKSVPTLVEPHISCSGRSKRSTHTRRSASGADINRMINLAYPRPRPTLRVPRNDRPCNRCGRGCLLAPPTDRTPPAGTLPPVVSNVRFTNSLLGFLIESARVGPRSRRGMLSTIMEPLKIDPCLLVRHKYRHTTHHAAASLSFKFVPAPLGATHDTNATRPTTSTTAAPPCPPPTRCAGGPTRAVACEAEYFFGSSSSLSRR